VNKLIISLAAVLMVGCSSTPAAKSSGSDSEKMPSTQASEPGTQDAKESASEVLNKNKKCPKKSKMVNGKCMLQVESNDGY
jgi:PBP1b-binding outer membrane lipoprotein LpoB